MRWIKTVAWLAPVLWGVQLVVFILLFASAFTRLTVQCLAFIGLPVRETALNAFLTGLLKILSWPVRPIFASAWNEGTFLTNVLLMALNSLVWSSVAASILFLFTKPKKSTSDPRRELP